MKNKFLMFLGISIIAIGLTGCNIGQSPAKPLSESGQTKYIDYSAEKFAEIRGKQRFVVFFHANWCGTCRAWEKNIIKIAPELSKDAIILKANYDEEKDLLKKYHIKSQSSAVFFNKKGEVTDTIVDPSMNKIKEFFAETKVAEIIKGQEEKIKDSEKEETVKTEENIVVNKLEEGITENVEEIETKTPAKYIDYTVENRQSSAGEKHLIFFYANWCSVCKAWDKKLKNELENMPNGTVVLKANYDNDSGLKKEFGIASQSTAVFVNADGSVAKKIIDPKMAEVKEFFSN